MGKVKIIIFIIQTIGQNLQYVIPLVLLFYHDTIVILSLSRYI